MEFIGKDSIKKLSNPGVDSMQLLNPDNSKSNRITITNVFIQENAIQIRHKHESSEQIWIAIKGTGTLLLEENEEKQFSEGDVVRGF